MSADRIVGVGGVPGSGKSTVVQAVMKRGGRFERFKFQTVEGHYCKERDLWVLGKYADGDLTPGTDRLSMAVINDAIFFLQTREGGLVLFEGDRLFCDKFLDVVKNGVGTDTGPLAMKRLWLVLHLSLGEFQRRTRERRQIGIRHNDTFLKGRVTKYTNMLRTRSDISVMVNESEEQHWAVVAGIETFLYTPKPETTQEKIARLKNG